MCTYKTYLAALLGIFLSIFALTQCNFKCNDVEAVTAVAHLFNGRAEALSIENHQFDLKIQSESGLISATIIRVGTSHFRFSFPAASFKADKTYAGSVVIDNKSIYCAITFASEGRGCGQPNDIKKFYEDDVSIGMEHHSGLWTLIIVV